MSNSVSSTVELNLSVDGFRAFVDEMVSLLPKTRQVDKLAEATGRYYTVTEDVPEEEKFTLVAVRLGKDGKFVVQVQLHDLNKLSAKNAQNDFVTKYENIV